MARRRQRADEEEHSYWMSYSDMMAALLLVFVLIITVNMLQSKADYEKKEAELQESQKQLDKSRKIVDEQKKTMDSQQEQIDRIIGVRDDLKNVLEQEFSNSDLNVRVDKKTGAVSLDSNVFFDVNKYDLKPEGKAVLKKFLPKYVNILLRDRFKEYIAEIIIEGHTDTNGSYLYNLKLSQERALSVASFCLKDNNYIFSKKQTTELRKILTANGRSFSEPVYNKNGRGIDMSASRRVEFKFRLKTEYMEKEVKKIRENE